MRTAFFRITPTATAVAAVLVAGVAATPTAAAAQAGVKQQANKTALDRTKMPPVGATPALRVPAWTKATLSNGARLIVSPKRDLPLVSFTITFEGGANQFEPADKVGLANAVAQMLSEGTTTRTGEQISAEQQLLGTTISANISGERGSISFQALKDRFAPAVALVADMMLNPSFPADALERLRARTLVQLAQNRDQPFVISSNVFQRVLYGTEHPYGRFMTDTTVKAVTRDDVVAFHRAYFRPARAIITVTGDVEPETVRRELERAFAAWPTGGEKPSFAYPAPPTPQPRAIYLVDKPKAAQSSVAIGIPGPPRDTPDYYAIQVMNFILGGHFQSRLNHNIREVKGYSYGVRSGFDYGKGPGAFRAGGEVVTAKTDSALIEFMTELRGIVNGERPITDDEITQAKQSLIQRLPASFASVGATASSITNIYVQGLPEDYYQSFAARVNAVTKDDLMRVAKQYVDLDRLAIVIVGDRATIEERIAKTGVGPITVLDIEGRRVGATP
ncbi:MAG: M16 family metallopeptidase [Gemmatimonadaceae bacterium]